MEEGDEDGEMGDAEAAADEEVAPPSVSKKLSMDSLSFFEEEVVGGGGGSASGGAVDSSAPPPPPQPSDDLGSLLGDLVTSVADAGAASGARGGGEGGTDVADDIFGVPVAAAPAAPAAPVAPAAPATPAVPAAPAAPAVPARRRLAAAAYCRAPPPHRGGAPCYLFRLATVSVEGSCGCGRPLRSAFVCPNPFSGHRRLLHTHHRLVRLRIKNIPCPKTTPPSWRGGFDET